MRILSAVVAIVLGAVALFVGIGQKTFWAPPETLTATLGEVADAPLTVIEPTVADIHDEPVQITIESPGEFNLMLGRSGDVDAWVEGAAVNRITGLDAENQTVVAEHVEGEAVVPSPATSDLWVASDKATKKITHTWTEPAEGEWSLLLAVDGELPAPVDITFEWPNDASTPFALALIIAGALLILLGLIRLVMPSKPNADGRTAAQKDQGVADSKGGAGVAQRVVAAVAALGLATAGAGAAHASPSSSAEASESASESAETSASPSESASSSESAASEDSEAQPYAVLLDTQLERILKNVADTVAAGDEAQDVEALKPRAEGIALSLRELNYKQRADGLEIDPVEPIAAGPVLSAAVTTDTSWPRTVVAVTQVEGASVPRVLTLRQASPRENYKLTSNIPMLPGSTFPGIAVGDPSIKPLDPSAENGLQMAPAEALDALAHYLSHPTVEEKNLFAQSPFISSMHENQEATRNNEDNREFANINFERAVDVSATHALATPDGGAVVVAAIDSKMITKPREEGGTVSWGDDLYAKMAGTNEVTGSASFNYTDTVAVYIPASGSEDKIQVIGGESILKSVTVSN